MEWLLSWAMVMAGLAWTSMAAASSASTLSSAAVYPQQPPSLLVHPLEAEIEHGPLIDELAEEAWWSGVDIVDTALRPEDHLELLESEDFCPLWDSACEDPARASAPYIAPPQLLPPPPPPPFLNDWLQTFSSDNSRCLLCEWAALNDTTDLLSSTDAASEHTWIPMLVVVALVSAMLGAILMIVALKCRRFKVLPRGGSCTAIPIGYVVGDKDHPGSELPDSPKPINTVSSSTDTSLDTTRDNVLAPKATANTGWRVKLWRKMTSHNASSSPASCKPEDDNYDSMSAVYAELHSVAGSANTRDSIYGANMYSEIAEPQLPPFNSTHTPSPGALTLRKLLSNGTYENAAYVISERVVLEVNDSSSGCASTPSSAYYSDLSNSDRSANGRPQPPPPQQHWPTGWSSQPQQPQIRHKRLLEHHQEEPPEPVHPAAIHSQTNFLNARHIHDPSCNSKGNSRHLNASQHSHGTLSSCNPPLLALDLTAETSQHHDKMLQSRSLPHHAGHRQHPASLICHQDPLNHLNGLQGGRDLMPMTLEVVPDNVQVPSDSHLLTDLGSLSLHRERTPSAATSTSSTTDALINLHHFSRGGYSASLNTLRRPLPPLPSRQVQGPKRRFPYQSPALGAAHEDPGASPLASVPSEYV